MVSLQGSFRSCRGLLIILVQGLSLTDKAGQREQRQVERRGGVQGVGGGHDRGARSAVGGGVWHLASLYIKYILASTYQMDKGCVIWRVV